MLVFFVKEQRTQRCVSSSTDGCKPKSVVILGRFVTSADNEMAFVLRIEPGEEKTQG